MIPVTCIIIQVLLFSFVSGGLSLAVEGPSKAEISCKDNKDGTCTVSYMPTAPGDYNIIVKFDDKHIPGSPFTAKITGVVSACQCGIKHFGEHWGCNSSSASASPQCRLLFFYNSTPRVFCSTFIL